LLSPNVLAVAIFRFSIWFNRKGWRLPSVLLYYFNSIVFGFDASPMSSIGAGLVMAHLCGCALHAKIGRNCTLYGRAAIGGKGRGGGSGWFGGPILGDRVTVGFGGAAIGDFTVGDDATIGAGSWCFQAVEPKAIMAGVPAKLLRLKTDEDIREEARYYHD